MGKDLWDKLGSRNPKEYWGDLLKRSTHRVPLRKGRQSKELAGEDIRTMRELYSTGQYTQDGIAEVYSVDLETVKSILDRGG